MKNTVTFILVIAIIANVGLGCSLVGRASERSEENKTLKDKAIDIAVGDEKIGVPECDEVMDFLNKEMSNPDDDFVTKAVKATALKKFKEKFREAIEENKTDKVELAKTCREFKSNLEIYKAERDSNR